MSSSVLQAEPAHNLMHELMKYFMIWFVVSRHVKNYFLDKNNTEKK